jgi:sugar phosphate isomerase/epimerase
MISYIATCFSCPHGFGLVPALDGTAVQSPITIEQWMDEAVSCGLAGVEIAIKEPDCNKDGLARIRDAALARGLKIILAAGVVDVEELRRNIHAATVVSGLERPVVRAIISRVLCGDRRTLGQSWNDYTKAILAKLKEVVPLARDTGVGIALENHQDATSKDLIELSESAGVDVVGACLDTGNPLAVSEDPVDFARRVAPFVRHVHLKDYRMYFAPDGFRLARCAAGEGAIDFAGILRELRASPHSLMPGVEIAAQPARHVRLLDPGWWDGYESRPAQDALPALRVLWEKGIARDIDWRNPYESGESSEAVCADEFDLFRRSVRYFRNLKT